MTKDQIIANFQDNLKDEGLYSGVVDGKWGPLTQEGLMNLLHGEHPIESQHRVLASSFADPQDIRAFKKCKDNGGSDQDCFKVGDNGEGYWGDDTTVDVPMVALPPEDIIEKLGKVSEGRGKLIKVTANGRTVLCELRDTMPHRAHIENGAGIDCNPAAVKALGQTIPMMISAVWSWV